MSQRSKLVQAIGLVGWLAVVFTAAAIGAIASVDAGSFYAQLAKPAWAPPAFIFGPVWSLLYLLMGISAWLVWREQGARGRTVAVSVFFVQLGVNALWSWLFFVWRSGVFAFIEVLALLVLVAMTLVAFWRIRRLAGLLLVPYLVWVFFASALTWTIWQGNPTLL